MTETHWLQNDQRRQRHIRESLVVLCGSVGPPCLPQSCVYLREGGGEGNGVKGGKGGKGTERKERVGGRDEGDWEKVDGVGREFVMCSQSCGKCVSCSVSVSCSSHYSSCCFSS